MLGMNKPPSETNNFQWDYVATFNLVNFQIVSFFNGKVEEMKTDTFSQLVTQHVSHFFNLGTCSKQRMKTVMTENTSPWLASDHDSNGLEKERWSPISKAKRPNEDYFSSNGPSAIDFRRRDVWKFLEVLMSNA